MALFKNLFIYVNVTGVNGRIYAIKNVKEADVIMEDLDVGDFLSIRGVGFLKVKSMDYKENIYLGVKEATIFINVNRV